MAVKLEFINVIVPNATFQAVFAEEGGFAFFKQSYSAMRDTVWYDDHICRVDGAMNWADVEDMVHWWEERGLIGLADTDIGKQWRDFCVATSFVGPTYRCNWLEFDAGDNAVSMRGQPKGRIVGKEGGMVITDSSRH